MARKLTGNLLIMMSRRRLAGDALKASNLHASGSAGGGQTEALQAVCLHCVTVRGREWEASESPAQQGRKRFKDILPSPPSMLVNIWARPRKPAAAAAS